MRAKKEDYSHIEASTTQDAATTTDTATNNATPEDDFEQFSNQEDEEKVRTYLHVSLFIVFRRLKKPGLKRRRREMQQKRLPRKRSVKHKRSWLQLTNEQPMPNATNLLSNKAPDTQQQKSASNARTNAEAPQS